MDAVMDFFKGLPAYLWDLTIHPPFKLDPTVENTAAGLGILAVILGVAWLKNWRSR